MNKKISLLIVSAILASALSACQSYVKERSPGLYERNSSYTDSDGTTRERQTSTDITVDSDGNRKTVVRSRNTTDPKGLFNKSTTSRTREVIEEKQ